MTIQGSSSSDPIKSQNPLDQIYKKLNDNLDRMRQERIDSVKEIAKLRLSEYVTPENFKEKFDWEQRDQILKDQFFNKVSSEELKPYLMVDGEYLVKHFKNLDLISADHKQNEQIPDSIPNDYYYDYEEIEKTLRFPIQGISGEEAASVLKEINPEVIREIHTLDLYHCFNMKNLKALESLSFSHLHELNCGGMSKLETLEGIPKCTYREINLKSAVNLVSLSHLEGLSVKKLNLQYCGDLTDLTPLLHVRDLEVVNISSCISADPTPDNVRTLETLKERGVKIHADRGLIAWRKRRDLFEEIKSPDISKHIKV